MAARIAELEDAVDQARNRANKLEKDKSRLQIEVRDLTVQLESVRTIHWWLLVTDQKNGPLAISFARKVNLDNCLLTSVRRQTG